MPRLIEYGTRALAVLLLVAASGPFAPSQANGRPGSDSLACTAYLVAAAPLPAEDPPPTKCCFTNPAYAGTCEAEPAKDETCTSILGYLNNPLSQGKGYCGNTTIRGGWKSVVCEPKK